MKNITISEDYKVNISGTSDGNQDKYYLDGIWYKQDHFGCEGFNEAFVSELLEVAEYPEEGFVKYESLLINGEHGCASRDFTKPGEQVVSIYRLYESSRGKDIEEDIRRMDMDDAIEYTLRFVVENTGLDLRSYFADIFYLDSVILNTDRHLNNIAVIFDRDTGDYRQAPIFDNGRSFFCGDKKYDPSLSIDENIGHLNFRPFSSSAILMAEYLKESRRLDFDRERVWKWLQTRPESMAKEVICEWTKNVH